MNKNLILATSILCIGIIATNVLSAAAEKGVLERLSILEESLKKGAVIAYDLKKCPTGWEDYKPAYGRFIRGIDIDGKTDPKGKRPAGDLQQDSLQGHFHNVDQGGASALHGSGEGDGGKNRAAKIHSHAKTDMRKMRRVINPITDGKSGAPRIDKETRPVNVALLYCIEK